MGNTSYNEVPIWQKLNLTILEASAYSGLGEKKIRQLVNEKNCSFILKNGSKNLIKRGKFEKWLEETNFV